MTFRSSANVRELPSTQRTIDNRQLVLGQFVFGSIPPFFFAAQYSHVFASASLHMAII